ncbi:hypothetical protein [Streptomyces sp. 5-6(2022)]|uniref:hypothetical protein n=1 Tax=Streptomyces sp. 5-6(2022) TaxID=2936510 RepID=UPI0023B9AA53|nr:hypothetical protein [Streptomyces sp. 5-6(2022)]
MPTQDEQPAPQPAVPIPDTTAADMGTLVGMGVVDPQPTPSPEPPPPPNYDGLVVESP